METKDYLRILVEDIHSCVVATIDENGHPITRVIDMMLYDEKGVYFLTAKGKVFYEQLMNQKYISLSCVKGQKSISLSGHVRNIGHEKLDEIFEKNPYMKKIYPKDTRNILQVFILDKGEGQFFDISNPSHITRGLIQLGDVKTKPSGYFITSACIQCGKCLQVCPQQCIDCTVAPPAQIDQNRCLHCGQCEPICPVQAIVQR